MTENRCPFEIMGNEFHLNGKKFVIYSGEMHPSRIPHEYWGHRIQMAAAMGLNTIGIYSFWNAHEPKVGEFDFNGNSDVAEFLRLVKKNNMYAIVRPGPYCCAEWDFGGFPPFLLKSKTMRLRCQNEEYLEYVRRYLKKYLDQVADLQVSRGGPILMFQVENEYGSYGRDKDYLRSVKKIYDDYGIEVPLFTSDGNNQYYLTGGTLPDVLPVVNFGGDPESSFKELEKFRSDIPHMCGEFYPGWFNHWGNKFLVRPRTKHTIDAIKWMIEHEKSFNLYVVHGGTNFGWTAGANEFEKYKPDITSYDYAAPIMENGLPNETYHGLRELLQNARKEEKIQDIPAPNPTIEFFPIKITESASLFENLPEPIHDVLPETMEHYDQNYGYINYRTIIDKSYTAKSLKLSGVHDIAHIYCDGTKITEFERNKGKFQFKIPKTDNETSTIDIFVEPLGRVNYGFGIGNDRKGILGPVILTGSHVLMKWEIHLFPMQHAWLQSIPFKKDYTENRKPTLHRGFFDLETTGDCHIDMRPYQRGMVWINGKNLGRYWNVGPQFSLYIPAPWLNKGKNEIIFVEFEGPESERKIKKASKDAIKQGFPQDMKRPYLILRKNRV